MGSPRTQQWLVELAFGMAAFAVGAIASILLGVLGIVLGLAALFAAGALVGARSASGWWVPGVPGMAVGVVALVVGLPLAQLVELGTPATGDEVLLVVGIAAFMIGALLIPGALIGRGLARSRPGLAAVGCVVPIVLALVAAAILASIKVAGT